MRARHYVLDEDNLPLPVEDVIVWARWFETADRKVANDYIGAVQVSTVFLGLDHNWQDGAPLLWETMIFGGPRDGDCERYASRAAALDGHARALALVREGTPV